MPIFHDLAFWRHGDVGVIRIGENWLIDDETVGRVGDELSGLADAEECRNLVLNFGGVLRLSSMMLGRLTLLQRKMQSKGGRLIICNVGPEMRTIFIKTRLDQVLEIRGTEADALRALAPSCGETC